MKTEGFWLSANGENHGNDSRPGDRWVTLADLTGAELIAMERQRQMSAEGWTPEHDDKHCDSELARAAATYALPHWLRELHVRPLCTDAEHTLRAKLWPWEFRWWKPTPDRVRELVKAGALIAAEIDRLHREAGSPRRSVATPFQPQACATPSTARERKEHI